jgi:hypothetical protein
MLLDVIAKCEQQVKDCGIENVNGGNGNGKRAWSISLDYCQLQRKRSMAGQVFKCIMKIFTAMAQEM